jgi:hypothetical protein
MRFKEFLLTEQREFLIDKINDILTGIHELLQAGKQMGARQMLKNSEEVVGRIRSILHGSWPRSEHKYLKVLQKCGVALMKAIDEKGDLPEVFNSVRAELEKLSGKFKKPVNKLGTADEEKPEQPEEPPPGQEPGPPPGPQEQMPMPPNNMAQQTTGQ